MTMSPPGAEPRPIVLDEGRFARLHAIEWWDRSAVEEARVLVVGAGALGNEVIKNLALLGIGHLAIVDKDRIEVSNLCRSVLFRECDTGRPKAERAAAAARELHPGGQVVAIDGDATADLGLGWFRWADVVVGALDNREARLFVNAACARVGTPWIDGGIEALRGVVRGFAPPRTACYQCTMGKADWAIVNQRRSCSLLARRAFQHGGVPTTPTAASLIGALQAQEVLRIVHGMEALLGRGIVHDASAWLFEPVAYELDPDCDMHDELPRMIDDHGLAPDAPLMEVWAAASRHLGGCDALVLSREIIESLTCADCGTDEAVLTPAQRIDPGRVPCPRCGAERAPRARLEIAGDSPLLALRAGELGLPAFDITWARRRADVVGVQLDRRAPGLTAPA